MEAEGARVYLVTLCRVRFVGSQVLVAPFHGQTLTRFDYILEKDLVTRTTLPAGLYDKLIAALTSHSQGGASAMLAQPALSKTTL